jgi:hypothetical protein
MASLLLSCVNHFAQATNHMTPTRDASGDDLVHRLKAEFLEMPGLKLTQAQAQRLWGLDAISCATLLEALVTTNFLFRTRDGSFMRVERSAPVRASLGVPAKPAAVA